MGYKVEKLLWMAGVQLKSFSDVAFVSMGFMTTMMLMIVRR